MTLARSLNYRSVNELCNTMDSAEFCLWAAEFERSPWDECRADLRAAIVACTVANFAGKVRKSSAEPAKPLDFMPYAQPEPEEAPTGADDLNQFIAGYYQHGG